jgi:hypothetical protein
MKERLEHLGQVSSHLTRRWAQHSAHAVQRYGSILAGYGRGELSVTAAGEALLRLVADEAKRYSEDAVEFGATAKYPAADNTGTWLSQKWRETQNPCSISTSGAESQLRTRLWSRRIPCYQGKYREFHRFGPRWRVTSGQNGN